jgi:AAA ATPase-like protein
MSLRAAHQGYEYQDLLVAYRFVDVLLGSIVETRVDLKLFADDRFDDLTTIDREGNRERVQFKHTESPDRPLSLRTFTSEDRSLRLDRVIASILNDRAGPGHNAKEILFRIVLRDQAPIDPNLLAVLIPLGNASRPFIPTMRTIRFGFHADALWKHRGNESAEGIDRPFEFLFAESDLSFSDLEWACTHLVVEVGAPPMSGDLTAPEIGEQLLLTRMRVEVGAETFPNERRTAIDVSAAMLTAARAARQGRLDVIAPELLRITQLRSDFGAVSRAHPVDGRLEVLRRSAVRNLVDGATEQASVGGHLLVIGPPGQGKSWVCHQLLKSLSDEGWLIAEHYCYLGDADGERLERVLAEGVFGSLVGRLASADPRLVTDIRPRFGADEDALVSCLRRSLDLEPGRRIALVIDGIDHITRVRTRGVGEFDPSRSLGEALASLSLPLNTVVIVLSQPGTHLQPIEDAGGKLVTVPGLDHHELRLLAAQFNIVPREDGDTRTGITPLIDEVTSINEFLSALSIRSAGNALYATYLCRETLRLGDSQIDPTTTVQSLPDFDGTLKNYYDHLYQSLGTEAGWVADILALVDFGLTRAELREIRPDAAHRVDHALDLLAPALMERATQGGIRVYHESFSRYLRKPFQDNQQAHRALLELIARWLDSKGFFVDSRAFRTLLTILSEAALDTQVVNLVDRDFVTKAVAAGFPSSGIVANLATAIGSAAHLGKWPAVLAYVELARAAETLQNERFDSTMVSFADVQAAILSADTVANRLIDGERLVMPARAGLQMCAAVDALGATAPWRAYMIGYLREEKADNTSYGAASNQAVAIAWLRGRLRLASQSLDLSSAEILVTSESSDNDGNTLDPARPINWTLLAKWIEENELSAGAVIKAIEDTFGLESVKSLIESLQNSGEFRLALAERLNNEAVIDAGLGTVLSWATSAVEHGLPTSSMHRIMNLGVRLEDLLVIPISDAREQLLDLTRRVQEPSVRREDGTVGAWLDACVLAAHRDQLGLNTAEALISGEGWYRCWLRFVIGLSAAEAGEVAARGQLIVDALRYLTVDLNPFSGDPRACDLYSLHDLIQGTIIRAMSLLDDEQWKTGISILKQVSSSITTTLSGELGGPIPPSFLLQVAVAVVTPARLVTAETLLEQAMSSGASGRFYTDLAEYRLMAARLALAANNMQRAQDLWQEACIFLTAYGWHKDITIYELLDPLPALIKMDPARGRLRVAQIQGLCKRVLLHTDGDETRHARSRWWELLAMADPVAAVQLVVPRLLEQCNNPNELLNDAIEDVWRQWNEQIDPLLSGALRLTLEMTLQPDDMQHFERLGQNLDQEGEVFQQLMTWLLARLDERPVSYSYSNSDELIAKDNDILAGINEFAVTMNLPPVGAIEHSTTKTNGARKNETTSRTISSNPTEYTPLGMEFQPGLVGLSRAIRVWRNRPYDAQSVDWTTERFANIIGYRLIEVVSTGLYQEAESALRFLANVSSIGEQGKILRLIAEGLERHGIVRLAAVAYSLTWTNARGRGGWMTFGGETEIDALRQATTLDSETTFNVVAEEVERIVATSRYGTYGISQALIYAFSAEAMTGPEQLSLDVAFAAWDEAFAIIEARSPRVDTSDDPEYPYMPPVVDQGEAAPGDLSTAIALATIAGLAHPSREKKRRSFLAAQLLINERASVAASAFKVALSSISDPATLTWLLKTIESSGESSTPVRESCQEILRDLARRDLIVIRALARRMLIGEQAPIASPGPADPALLGESETILWKPVHMNFQNNGSPTIPDELIDSVAKIRLQRSERLLPGLYRATRERVAKRLTDQAYKSRLNSQLKTLADRNRKRWPDAFLASDELVEEVIQFTATGGRTARMIAGDPISDPIGWEDTLAVALIDDPNLPLMLEGCRQPRPNLPAPPSGGDELWRQIYSRAEGDITTSVEEALKTDGLLKATIAISPCKSVSQVEQGRFRGWYWFGTMEHRWLKPPNSPYDAADVVAERFQTLEIRNKGDRVALTLPPIAPGDIEMWTPIDGAYGSSFLDKSQPLVGFDHKLLMLGDSHSGIGVPESLLTPTASLINILDVQSNTPFSYQDQDGVGLALVIWRAEYDTSDYYLTRPRTYGSGIVIRADLLVRLIDAVGEERLVLRDYVVGALELIAPEKA